MGLYDLKLGVWQIAIIWYEGWYDLKCKRLLSSSGILDGIICKLECVRLLSSSGMRSGIIWSVSGCYHHLAGGLVWSGMCQVAIIIWYVGWYDLQCVRLLSSSGMWAGMIWSVSGCYHRLVCGLIWFGVCQVAITIWYVGWYDLECVRLLSPSGMWVAGMIWSVSGCYHHLVCGLVWSGVCQVAITIWYVG